MTKKSVLKNYAFMIILLVCMILGALTGGLKASAGGITAAMFFGLLAALLFKPKDKS